MSSPTRDTDPTASVDLRAAEGLLPPLPRAFLAGRDRELLAPLRFLEPSEDAVATLAAADPPEMDPAAREARAEIAQELRIVNRSRGNPRADRLADRLADPATRVVVTGQQPGLFGGPLYTLSKMIAASRWAAALEEAGVPAVPVFWIATEDHDWAEVAQASFLAPDGPRRLDLGEAPHPLRPVGMTSLGDGVEAVFEELSELRGGDRFEAWVERLRRDWRPDDRFGESFGRWAAGLLGERCPLLLDAMAPAVKAAERPWMRRLVERRGRLEEAYRRADAAIEAQGHPLQVSPQPWASPLFLFRWGPDGGGERRRIEWRGPDGETLDGPGDAPETWRLRGTGDDEAARPVEELLGIIDDNPIVVSPGVLARPALQDAILGSTLQILGPGEMSYMPQAAATYRVLELPGPFTTLRPQVLVLEGHQRSKMEELGLSLADLVGDADALDQRLAGGSAGFVARGREAVEEVLTGVEERALELDPNLERPWQKTRDQILRALGTFEDKAVAAAARRDEVTRQRVEKLRGIVRPGGTLQERVLSSSHWPGKYGEELVEAFWEQMDLDGGRLGTIEP